MTQCLFIGGPIDGEWRDVDTGHSEIYVPAHKAADWRLQPSSYSKSLETVAYIGVRLQLTDIESAFVYVYGDDSMTRLLYGYVSEADRASSSAKAAAFRSKLLHVLKGYTDERVLSKLLDSLQL